MSKAEIDEQNRRNKLDFQKHMMTVDIYVNGFDHNVTKEELEEHFKQFGTIKSMKIDKREYNLNKENAAWFELAPFALISFDTPSSANSCL